VAGQPDVIWDRPDLERLYARLQDEYELTERADALSRKLAVISETAEVLTDHDRHNAPAPGNSSS